jgi:transcriptional regulator with XRE-family HTH domain
METTLRRAIKKSGRTYYDIANKAGVARSILTLFMAGDRTVTLPIADRIAKVVGLELREKGRRSR